MFCVDGFRGTNYLYGRRSCGVMTADTFGLFETRYVENSHRHSSEAARDSGGRRGHPSQADAFDYSRSCAMGSTRIRALTGRRPQGYPNVTIWPGHFLPVPTAVRSLEERAARRQFLCRKTGRDRRRDIPEKPGYTAWQHILLYEKGLSYSRAALPSEPGTYLGRIRGSLTSIAMS
jgi:hypothetical protein